jgi:cold shock CspA family protein
MNFKLFDCPRLDAHIRALSLDKSSEPAPRRNHLESQLHLGNVSRWNRIRGFGFIASDGPVGDLARADEIYCHRTGLPEGVSSLEPGCRVEFVLAPPHMAGKPQQARVLCIIAEAQEAA